MKQPVISLSTPSGATVELRAHRVGNMNYTASISINNTQIAFLAAFAEHEMDDKNLILDHAHIRLTDEGVTRASAFFKETANYINGDEA